MWNGSEWVPNSNSTGLKTSDSEVVKVAMPGDVDAIKELQPIGGFCTNCGNGMDQNWNTCPMCGVQRGKSPNSYSGHVEPKISLPAVIKSVLTNWFGKGTATRREFWLWHLGFSLPIFFLLELRVLTGGDEWFGFLFLFAVFTLIPNISLLIRRTRDAGIPLVYLLLIAIPFIGIAVMIWISLQPSADLLSD